jgi:hypothetical protein
MNVIFACSQVYDCLILVLRQKSPLHDKRPPWLPHSEATYLARAWDASSLPPKKGLLQDRPGCGAHQTGLAEAAPDALADPPGSLAAGGRHRRPQTRSAPPRPLEKHRLTLSKHSQNSSRDPRAGRDGLPQSRPVQVHGDCPSLEPSCLCACALGQRQDDAAQGVLERYQARGAVGYQRCLCSPSSVRPPGSGGAALAGLTQVTMAPHRLATPPASWETMWLLASHITECGGHCRYARMLIWLPMVPLTTKRLASLPAKLGNPLLEAQGGEVLSKVVVQQRRGRNCREYRRCRPRHGVA